MLNNMLQRRSTGTGSPHSKWCSQSHTMFRLQKRTYTYEYHLFVCIYIVGYTYYAGSIRQMISYRLFIEMHRPKKAPMFDMWKLFTTPGVLTTLEVDNNAPRRVSWASESSYFASNFSSWSLRLSPSSSSCWCSRHGTHGFCCIPSHWGSSTIIGDTSMVIESIIWTSLPICECCLSSKPSSLGWNQLALLVARRSQFFWVPLKAQDVLNPSVSSLGMVRFIDGCGCRIWLWAYRHGYGFTQMGRSLNIPNTSLHSTSMYLVINCFSTSSSAFKPYWSLSESLIIIIPFGAMMIIWIEARLASWSCGLIDDH